MDSLNTWHVLLEMFCQQPSMAVLRFSLRTKQAYGIEVSDRPLESVHNRF